MAVPPAARDAVAPDLAGLLPAEPDGADLGRLYEALLDPAVRRRQGSYYTPPAVVATILDATLNPLLEEARAAPDPAGALRALRVLDPACGAGAFLAAAGASLAAALAAAGVPDALAAAAACLYGVDSDPVAVDLTRYTLALAGLTAPGGALRVVAGDGLAALPAGWPGFDAVVGNPPYVAHRAQPAAAKAARAGAFVTARGQYDLSVLFLERGLQLLRPGGVLGYIVPNKFMAADYGVALRALLLGQMRLLRLIDVSRAVPFPGAAAYPVIVVAQRAVPAPDHRVVLAAPGRPDAAVRQTALGSLPGGALPAAATPGLLAFARHLAAQPGRLPTRAIRCGVARAGHARAALSAAAYAALPLTAQADHRPLLQVQDLVPYGLRPDTPARYLPRTAMTAAQWEAFAAPAVLVPGVARRLWAASAPGGYARGRVYGIAAGATAYDPWDLLGLLNARLLGWYYRFCYWPAHLAGGYLRINAPYLAQLPLPPLEVLATRGPGPHARALAAESCPDPEEQAALDAAVCRLYGVTVADLAAAEAALDALIGPAPAGRSAK